MENRKIPVGSDLGNGVFQFQFEQEADLVAVLERRPYHFAKWMVIVQHWEPTVSDAFPSLIPFWIKVQGIPIHLWSEDIVRSLGEEIGIFEQAEVTALSMRMRRHRSSDHRYDARDAIETQRRSRSLHGTQRNRVPSVSSKDLHKSCYGGSTQHYDNPAYHLRLASSWPPLRNEDCRHLTSNSELLISPTRSRGRHTSRREDSSSSKILRTPRVRGNPLPVEGTTEPQMAFNEALEEVREVMVQYTQCADPSESAARRERLRKHEEEGHLEETTTCMVQASFGELTTPHQVEDAP
ncbi:hypothetical protein N665_1047s0006 [Sinapis alba]|nr:hypothetical protein N665_1047s0006 [Sinapis alba]